MELPLGREKGKPPLSGPALEPCLFSGAAGSLRRGVWGGANAAANMTNRSLLMGRDRSARAGFCLGTVPASAIMHLGKDLLLEIFTRVYYFCWIPANEWKFPLGGGRKISGKTSKTERIKDRINWATTSIFRTKNQKVIIHSWNLTGFILNSNCLCIEGRQKAQ